ncbi:hypothetical protein VT52_026915 [Streptomyces malaysiense]|uniref:Uncharacterized protein n=1 Tax=Streptomyces malaysiense TaxID=1428626 RepID=A0A1J4PUV9_9ACTN|nr:hypothetical protein VT52_026915 [Streptomyces malaysiense]
MPRAPVACVPDVTGPERTAAAADLRKPSVTFPAPPPAPSGVTGPPEGADAGDVRPSPVPAPAPVLVTGR